MTIFLRWRRFNAVGTMGMVLQLTALSAISRWTEGHFLYATAAALELTLVHNFVWHLHFTWRDRCSGSSRLIQFVRFHLSNGLVSMLGNLALMWVLVRAARLPVLASDGIAIVCCSIVNFCLGDRWVFRPRAGEAAGQPL